jgi:hypothetical protein
MTSPRVMWTLQNMPCATAVKGDSCAVGPENKVNQKFWISGIVVTRSWKSLHSELPGTENPKSRSSEVPKPSETKEP